MNSNRFPYAFHGVLVGAVVLVFYASRLWLLMGMSESELIKRVPDDGFYYLVLAKHFAAGHGWTFDGSAPATGFHLLWAYLLAAWLQLFPDASWQSIFLVCGLVGSVCLAMAAMISTAIACRLAGTGALAGILLVFLAPAVSRQTTLMMETPLVILFSVLCYQACVSDRPWPVAWCLLAGLGGMLARSDFGLLTACLFGAALAMWLIRKETHILRAAAGVFAGAITGLAVTLLHTHWNSGQFVQASAQVKHHWALAGGRSIVPSLEVLVQAANPFASLPTWSASLYAGLGVFLSSSRWRRGVHFVARIGSPGLSRAHRFSLLSAMRCSIGRMGRSRSGTWASFWYPSRWSGGSPPVFHSRVLAPLAAYLRFSWDCSCRARGGSRFGRIKRP